MYFEAAHATMLDDLVRGNGHENEASQANTEEAGTHIYTSTDYTASLGLSKTFVQESSLQLLNLQQSINVSICGIQIWMMLTIESF